ncbi:AraC family transcriptional regulator [Aestuariicella hydrocarbonica]|uniref:AraC family transcriptional regulator n=1 Tax=Pseudomaricurvus hydrocarbonicus TaxID=1470433 RepID=A0A9E5JQU6_9GAMM|nr:AraC family transcriptional regulator [Aestuariicella hydrocarbonica]NHO64814.1 AraC family transcriptional regulator [Aestuariicella hydrocarbonica]
MATVASHHAQAALYGATRKGHDSTALLANAGIPAKTLQTEHTRTDEQQMTALIQAIWEVLDDEFMGFTATPCKRGSFAFMVQTARRCGTLREALHVGMQFYQLMTDDIHTELQEQDDSAHIRIRFQQPALDPEHFFLEFWLIIWHRLASWLIGSKIPLQETRLIHQSPRHARELHIMFPGPLHFGCKENTLSFHADYLQRPLVRSQQELTQFLKAAPADLLTIPGDDNSLQRHISQSLSASLSTSGRLTFPSLPMLAKQLHLSPQTLHRRLKQEGTSYQRIKDNLRRDLALQKLVREKHSVNDIAEVLGFSEARSFTRAFRQWTGLSPREYGKLVKVTPSLSNSGSE